MHEKEEREYRKEEKVCVFHCIIRYACRQAAKKQLFQVGCRRVGWGACPKGEKKGQNVYAPIKKKIST